jgi:C-terminal processing protease CtpA/Prc
VCLIGPGAISSGEGFVKMMKALPQVTTVGRRTRGASGNPQPVELPGLNTAVYFSRWVDMTPDGETFEGIGLAPDVLVDLPSTDHAEHDPTLDKGLEVLRARVAATADPR